MIMKPKQTPLELAKLLCKGESLWSYDWTLSYSYKDGRFSYLAWSYFNQSYHQVFLTWQEVLAELRAGIWSY